MVAGLMEKDATQLSMPGMPKPVSELPNLTCCKVRTGQQVIYIGDIFGGPRRGARGIVTDALHRKAVVDMGRAGTWNIPYYFLSLPEAA